MQLPYDVSIIDTESRLLQLQLIVRLSGLSLYLQSCYRLILCIHRLVSGVCSRSGDSKVCIVSLLVRCRDLFYHIDLTLRDCCSIVYIATLKLIKFLHISNVWKWDSAICIALCCQLQATMTGAGETENETFSVQCWDLYTTSHHTLTYTPE